MITTVKTAVSIQKSFSDEAEILAQQLNISQSHLFRIVIEDFLKNYQSHLLDEIDKEEQSHPNERAESFHPVAKIATQPGGGPKVISQGDIYWAKFADLSGSEPDYSHPHVVIQDNLFNRSRLNTVVVCALTSNMKRATEPGNILLEVGEANLAKQSVVVVSQVSTVDKTKLGAYIGSLSKQRIHQILTGMRFQQLSFFVR